MNEWSERPDAAATIDIREVLKSEVECLLGQVKLFA